MGKMAKKIQTDYTTGGRDISNTAVPLYQKNLNLISEYNSDPTGTIDMYKNKYYTNTANQSDFLTDYNRAMANKTNANYSATGGGYSSSGQRAYDDAQRYWNDRAARLEDYGVQSAASMAQNYYNNLLNANTGYNQAYNLGKEYSDIEQYNNLAKQNNSFKNQALGVGGGLMTGIGSVLTMIPDKAALGIGLTAAGSALGSQTIDGSSFGAGSSTTAGTGMNNGIFGTGLNADAFNAASHLLKQGADMKPNGFLSKLYYGRGN